ncbi:MULTISPECIES: hypothetical protein [Pirellulaceae]|nr:MULTISPECIES: hypothetical protein [Pirellulaceae]
MKALKKLAYLKLLNIPKDSLFWDCLIKAKQSAMFQERLVFSGLVSCDRNEIPASIRRLAKETCLSPQTVKASLRSLGDLVINKDGVWSPIEPDHSWFRKLSDPNVQHWSDHFSYVKLFLPIKGAVVDYQDAKRRFGVYHAAVYSQIVSLARGGDSATVPETALSTQLSGINRKTIASVLNDLDYLGLISRERFGRNLKFYLLPLATEHLSLFQQAPQGEKLAVKKPKPPADPNVYELKGDGLDEYREQCRGLMTQSYAEKAIDMSYKIGESFGDFCGFLSETKKWHEDNRLKGKITVGHIGRFLVARYNARFKEFARRKSEAEALEYLRSDEFQEKVQADEKAAAADPLHERHIFQIESITSRVQFDPNPVTNYRAAQRVIVELERHFEPFVKEEYEAVELKSALTRIVRLHLCHALAKVNRHYQSDSFASLEEFIEIINRGLRSLKVRMIPEFTFDLSNHETSKEPKNEAPVHK